MNIAFDAKRAFENTTGLGNYSRDTIQGMIQYHPEIEYSLWTPNINKAKSSDFFNFTHENRLPIFSPQNQWNAKIWRTYGLGQALKNKKIDLFHGLSNELPFDLKKSNIKSVVSIHDLIFKRYPSYYPFFDRIVYHYKVKNAVRQADLILAMSESTKKDLIYYYQANPEKIKIQYQSVHPIFSTKASAEVENHIQKKYQIPKKFALMVSAFEERKNHIHVLRALHQINDPSFHLVLVGRARPHFTQVQELIHDLNLHPQVTIISDAQLEELNALYQMAYLFIQSSFFEGFGIPVLEALTKNLPCILSNNSSFPEIAKDAALYFNPYHVEEISKQWKTLWENESLAMNLIRKIDTHPFKPETLSNQLLKNYKSIL